MNLRRIITLSVCLFLFCEIQAQTNKRGKNPEQVDQLRTCFLNPPDSVRPGVYWYFMDGNLSKEGMTKDLESMKKAGIGHVLFLEVNIGIPRGPIDFMSQEWQDLFKHAVSEAKRLGINFTLGVGPGWTGSGGPWVKPEESMQHLVYSVTDVAGPSNQTIQLAKPEPKQPYFGEKTLNEELKKKWLDFYEDVSVLAFPSTENDSTIQDVEEKALYYRAPYSSKKGVKPYLPEPINPTKFPEQAIIKPNQIIDLSNYLQADGSLNWTVSPGKWTIMRFGRRNNGAITRPAPVPGLGFECDKMDTTAFNHHFNEYIGKLLNQVKTPKNSDGSGWNMLHMDSWEMGAQNWTPKFREEFKKRRGYDPLPYFPCISGKIVASTEQSERFLWDLRQTAQELIIENHAMYLKKLGRKYGFRLSIEPYDMNPCADFDLGAVADVPMCEFWSKGYGFKTAFSCIEASSIANIIGAPVVGAEAFTAEWWEAWKMYPARVKNQGDWAFCTGVNHFVYHTFAHKPFDDKYQPGMTMAQYGVHWDRGQTWWPMASAYHQYISRCSYMLQQGHKVADILYLIPEGAPHVFLPPASALKGNDTIPDHKGYNFDACSAQNLISKASVHNKRITFPSGASYRILVLPNYKTMSPLLLEKISDLIRKGATIIGNAPIQSPSLSNYPDCDKLIREKALSIWKTTTIPEQTSSIKYGKGLIYHGGNLNKFASGEIYPNYDSTAAILQQLNLQEDFKSTGEIRYIHKTISGKDIYFLSNRTDKKTKAECSFRISKGNPELWDPQNGKCYSINTYKIENGHTIIPVEFDSYQSFFIVFDQETRKTKANSSQPVQSFSVLEDLSNNWHLSFDPNWGGPASVAFQTLDDWSKRPEDGIKYYSGIATYKKTFTISGVPVNDALYLDLGEVNNIARVKLNGEDLGIVWTAPWRIEITHAIKTGLNKLEIEVANLWVNRLIGDEQYPDDGIKDKKWPEWLLNGQKRTSQRYTFTTHHYYKKDMPLQKSGLIGPVKILKTE